MKYVWKKHTIGKRILALFLLVTMLFDTVTASAMEYNGEEDMQPEIVEVDENISELNVKEEEEFITETEEEVAETASVEEIKMAESALFEGLEVSFSNNKAYINGSVTNSYSVLYEMYYRCYDEFGREVGDVLELAVLSPGESKVFNSYEVALDANASYVELAFLNYEIGSVYSKNYDVLVESPIIGEFKDVSITFAGFSAYCMGSFTSTCDEYLYLYLTSYNDKDERLGSSWLTMCSAGSTASFNNYSAHVVNGAAYVQIEACSRNYGSTLQPVYSEKFVPVDKPDFSLKLESVETGASSLTAQVSYAGNLAAGNYSTSISANLMYGTSNDESTWMTKYSSINYYGDEKLASLKFDGLEEETTYYGKIRFYVEFSDQITSETIVLFEQNVSLEPFTTKANHTYNLKEAFPDAVLRALVLNGLRDNTLTEDSDVTTAQLEKVTYISNSRSTYNMVEPVTDLTGIDLLTNLQSLSLSCNELETVKNIDWSKMSGLTTLYLDKNNLVDVPDLSKNKVLKNVNLSENMLSDSELEKLYHSVTEGVLSSQTFTSQRSKIVELEMEDTYYKYAAGTPIIVQIKGQKCYSVKLLVDNVEQVFTASGNRLTITNSGLDIGSHTIKAELYNGTTKVAETEAYTFSVADTPVFVEKGKAYANANQSYVSLYVYMPERKNVSSATLIDETGKIFAKTTSTPSINSITTDTRYEVSWCYLPSNYLYYAYISLQSMYNTIPVGNYDISIMYADGTTELMKNAVEIVGKQDAVITNINYKSYDVMDSDEYIYLDMQGYNLEAEKFDYTLKYAFIEMPIQYVGSKVSGTNSILVKLKKDGWIDYPEQYGTGTLTVTSKDGYKVYGNIKPVSCYLQSSSMVYYNTYNFILEKLEIGVDEQYQNSTIKAEVREGYDANTYPLLASGSGTVSGERTFIDLFTADGSKFTPTNNKSYYVTYTIGNTTLSKNFYGYNYATSIRTNYWNSAPTVIKGSTSVNAYYYSDIPFGTVDASDFTAQITGAGITSPINVKRTWISSSNGGTMVGMEFDPSSLAEGTYNITLNKDGVVFATNTLKVINGGKFYLNSVSANWLSDSEIQLYLSTLNVSDSDEFDVVVMEENGTVVEGLTTEVTQRYVSGTVYVSIKGLNYDSAYKQYYMKVTHKTLGEACKVDGTNYFADEKGVLTTIYRSSWSISTNANGEIIGVYLNSAGIKFPATISIYKPYDTTVLKEFVVNDVSELENNYYYYFNKNFYDSLPIPGGTYDVVISDTTGLVGYQTRVVGYNPDANDKEDEEETKVWSYTVDKTTLNIDSESLKTATITVKDYTTAPTFKSSNTAVAKVTVSADDKGKAIITAVKEGTATITITADGTSKTFDVTVVSTVPKVTAQSKVVMNTFFGSEAKTALEITNSFGTEITNVTIAENEAGLTVSKEDGIWYLCWSDETKTIAKDTKVALTYEVEGFTATEDLVIAPQTITVNGKSTQPTTKLSATTLNFTLYPFKEQSLYLTVENNDYRNIVIVGEDNIVLKSAPSGVDKENTHISFVYDESGKLIVNVANEAKDGTYKYAITPGVGTDGAKDATTVNLTVTVKATKPVFKFNTSTVTLDAAYPGSSEGVIKLLMDEGYTLKEVKVVAPNEMSEDFISTQEFEDGTVLFRVIRKGLSSAGTYIITPTVIAPTGEIIELAQQKITVKVTNSSAVSLTSKTKSITVNPNLGNASVNANVKTKGIVQQEGVYYSVSYEVVPTNLNAKEAGMYLDVASTGAITVSNMGSCEDDKYTYNVVATVNGTDGTVTYSKPLPLTVQLKTKALTIVPEKKSVTVYKDYCTTITKEEQAYYQVVIPVSVKESAKMRLYAELTNSMADKGVCTYFNDWGDSLVIEFPTTLSSVKNLNITPDDERFASFKVSVTVKSSEPKAAFEEKTVTLNRYKDYSICNSVVDTEGYTISYIKDIVIKKGNTVMDNTWFETRSWDSTVCMGISAEYDDKVANASYKVSVTPVVIIDGEERDLAPCTFTLKVTQPKVKLEVCGDGENPKKVYLYPAIGVVSTSNWMNAYSDNEWIEIVETTVTTKDKKKYSTADVEYERWIDIHALQAEDGSYKNGKNTYSVTAKVRKANDVIDTIEYTLKNAFTVTVADLPKSIKLVKSKLTFSPNMAYNVTTSVKSTELNELVGSGEFCYDISVDETNKKYVKLDDESKNSVIDVWGSESGNIYVTPGSSTATKNATYYYLVTVNLCKYNDNYEAGEVVKTYTTKLSVAVKNTKPKAKLQMASISLDNAFVKQSVTNEVMLTTGTAFWNLKPLSEENVKVKSGNKDITSLEYFKIAYDEDSAKFTVSLNNENSEGTPMTVPKGTYKIVITPMVASQSYEEKETSIAAVTLTVKVTSSRPTVKVASKATVKAGGDVVVLTPTLKNNGKISALCVTKITKPKKATEADLEGIWLDILEDGTISVYAEEGVLAGTYKFTINPITVIDDMNIVLDKVTISVVVKK